MPDKTRMSKELLIEQQNFFKFISNYEYINKNGRLDLEAFCRYLSICFDCDGVLSISKNPRDMYILLINLIGNATEDNSENQKLWVQTQNLVDWTPKVADMYPDGFRTYIHVSALLLVMSDWIYQIGHILMELPESEIDRKYFAWVKKEWTFTFTFINGFHNFFFEYIKKFDKQSIKMRGYSNFEALSLSKRNDIDYDEAITLIKTRNEVYQDVIARIRKAIDAGYYLEAITLEECMISNCVYNYLIAKKRKLNQPTFLDLLKAVINYLNSTKSINANLFVVVNNWRKKRNVAIHGYVSTKTDKLRQSKIGFEEVSEATAKKGIEYCELVNQWYDSESVNFIEHKFDSSIDATLQ